MRADGAETHPGLARAFARLDPEAAEARLTLAAVGLYPLMLMVVRLFGGRMMRQQRRQQEALAQLSDLIQEDLSGISAIKIYGQETTERQAFAERNRRYRDDALQLARTRSTLFPLLEGISSVSLLLLLALGSGQLESGRLSIGDLRRGVPVRAGPALLRARPHPAVVELQLLRRRRGAVQASVERDWGR